MKPVSRRSLCNYFLGNTLEGTKMITSNVCASIHEQMQVDWSSWNWFYLHWLAINYFVLFIIVLDIYFHFLLNRLPISRYICDIVSVTNVPHSHIGQFKFRGGVGIGMQSAPSSFTHFHISLGINEAEKSSTFFLSISEEIVFIVLAFGQCPLFLTKISMHFLFKV